MHNIFYQAVPVAGTGSGTIIDSSGLILTNNHVVGGAQKINVTLGTNEVLEGTIVGSCAIHDIAVVKVDGRGRNLQAAEIGDSDKIRVGQRVYTIGKPFVVWMQLGIANEKAAEAGRRAALSRY